MQPKEEATMLHIGRTFLTSFVGGTNDVILVHQTGRRGFRDQSRDIHEL